MILRRKKFEPKYYCYVEVKDGKYQFFAVLRGDDSYTEPWLDMNEVIYKYYEETTMTREEAEFIHLL